MNRETTFEDVVVPIGSTRFQIIKFITGNDIFEPSKVIAEIKKNKTMQMSVSGRSRRENEIYLDHLRGKIADKSFRLFLEKNGFSIEEYDEIRSDDFQYPDPWDLKVRDFDFTCEVRSSCISQSSHDLQHVIQDYKILGPYTIPGYKIAEPKKFFYVQVMYIHTKENANQILERNESLEGYIVGHIDRQGLVERGFDWTYGTARYKAILIKDGYDLSDVCSRIRSYRRTKP